MSRTSRNFLAPFAENIAARALSSALARLRDSYRCQNCDAPRGRDAGFCFSCGTAFRLAKRRAFPAKAGIVRRALSELIDRLLPLPFLAYFFPEWSLVVLAVSLLSACTRSGRTAGKVVCRLRVISVASLEPCGMITAVARRLSVLMCLAAYLWSGFLSEWWLAALGYDLFSLLFICFNPSGRRLEDYLLGAQVVTEGAYRKMRRTCPRCETEMPARARYCRHCGADAEVRKAALRLAQSQSRQR
jgi:uncharacterized RDD family membrane protein YckC